MLFDLRSRGRRRTVQAIYLGLAIVMGGGLVLFGVGAGNGLGGLLDAFKGTGSNSGQQQAVSQQEQNALRQTRLNPNDPAAWAALVQARWTTATTNAADFNSTTQSFTAAGNKELGLLGQAWQRYTQLAPTPDANIAILAARAYNKLGNYSAGASAWETVATANPTAASAYECLAVSSYAAGQTRKGQLATSKALSLLPAVQRATAKNTLAQAKTSTTTAQQIAQQC